MDRSPGEVHAGAGVHAAGERGGQLGRDRAERVDEVLGEMGAGGVAARAAHLDPHGIGGGGDRAGLQTHVADVDPGVAVQGEDRVDALQDVLPDQLERAAGVHLLGGLEHQAHAASQRALLGHPHQRVRRAEHGAHVHVVAAGVGDALDGGAVGDGAELGDPERVHVRPQPDQRERRVRAGDVADQAGGGHALRREPEGGELLGDEVGGGVLLVGELGVAVEVAAHLAQGVAALGDGAGDQPLRSEHRPLLRGPDQRLLRLLHASAPVLSCDRPPCSLRASCGDVGPAGRVSAAGPAPARRAGRRAAGGPAPSRRRAPAARPRCRRC